MTFARLLAVVVGACLAFGLAYRLFPLVTGPDSLAQFFITEDGYLMLTAARNLAIGNGLSVSDGTIPTNGVQPLATLIYAVPYVATGGAKLASLAGIVAIMTAISVAAAFAVRAFARVVLAPLDAGPVWPWLVAALWFVGPLALLHSMNALETGLYVLAVAATVTVFARITSRRGRYTGRDQLVFGALCGLTFLARIDGALLVTALFLVRFVHVQWSRELSLREAVMEAIPPGLISLAFAAPWLIHNQVYFGSVMPISGTAQSMAASFGQNLPIMPAKLFETMLPMLPIPTGIERSLPVILVSLAALGLVLVTFLWQVTARRHPARVAIWGYALFGVALVGYYGLFFGAGHFLSRYLAPLGPLLIAAAVWVGLDLARRLPWGGAHVARVAGMGALALSVALLVRLTLPGIKEQGHFHVVDWVEENVDEETWVGAVQTGTLGYWHDRTVNLDGKVNPEALAARLATGSVLSYVAASEIDVIADWAGVAGWAEADTPAFHEAFELIVADPDRNLAVLRRRDAHAAGS